MSSTHLKSSSRQLLNELDSQFHPRHSSSALAIQPVLVQLPFLVVLIVVFDTRTRQFGTLRAFPVLFYFCLGGRAARAHPWLLSLRRKGRPIQLQLCPGAVLETQFPQLPLPQYPRSRWRCRPSGCGRRLAGKTAALSRAQRTMPAPGRLRLA